MAGRRDGSRLYFAYGSNLWLEQMAKRCPGSSFMGRGTLQGYRWQINQRGVANIVEAPSDSVEGLVFSVTAKDERALDRNEGVAKKFYERQDLRITLQEHPLRMNQKTSQVARWLEHNRDNLDANIDLSHSRQETRPALVYISDKYKEDGPIREEYIKRMQNAAADAVALGVSQSWVDRAMGQYINTPRTQSPPTQLPIQAAAEIASADESGRSDTVSPSITGRPPLQVSANPRPHPMNLQKLRESNREQGADSGVAFPQAMLEGVKFPPTAQDGEDETVYLVLASKPCSPTPRSGAGADVINPKGTVTVKWSTRDLDLANELAMRCFRELWSGICDDSLTGGYSSWARLNQEGDQPSPGLNWYLNDNVCLSLYGSAEEMRSVAVWVERQTLVRSCP
ncbi:hypothetical protein QBC37DRAFT_422925 [Rhypophila decipiens]|uniref:gamma-glutamylcyclotransferase n=1 Tax=Rhypophila decipiens TaxID=261697 RepID=A0AAN7B7Z7_9PEZI|nr:hypothetical protein QBC37DRAFT_422925 [Rhypophila decipiens]